MRALQARRAGRRRAFTMIELAVTVGLTAAMFALLLPWVLNLIVISSANLDSASTTRAAATISSAVDADLDRALACPSTGTALVRSDEGLLAVLTTNSTDGTGAPTLAVWRLDGTQLSRAQVPVDLNAEGCPPTGPDPLQPEGGATWTPFGGEVTARPFPSDAVVAFSAEPAQRADVLVFGLDVSAGDSTSAAAAVRATYPLPSAFRGLT